MYDTTAGQTRDLPYASSELCGRACQRAETQSGIHRWRNRSITGILYCGSVAAVDSKIGTSHETASTREQEDSWCFEVLRCA